MLVMCVHVWIHYVCMYESTCCIILYNIANTEYLPEIWYLLVYTDLMYSACLTN